MIASVQISGMNEVAAGIKKYGDNVVEEIVTVAGKVQALVVNYAKQHHPYTDRTTNLTQSIQEGPITVSAKKIEAVVEARMEYASFVEFGTSRSHAYPFMLPAVLRYKPTFEQSIAAAAKKARTK